ncbi:MAG: hypothetical protein AUG49_03400 [Catenulispora sp. 13_1_20CM_3_70_7]|nr:MAG: hypothetical protein AUG49_03400 [Catenulispora sp. 13_1_20CM_3_70_7]
MARNDSDRQFLAPQGPPPGGRQQVPLTLKRRRSAGDVLTGLAALLALLVLVIGVPLALAYFIGWPLPCNEPARAASRAAPATWLRTLTITPSETTSASSSPRCC